MPHQQQTLQIPSFERSITADAIRVVAAFCVVLSHVQATLLSAHFPSADQVTQKWGATLIYLFRDSSLYFFVLSGFILGSRFPIWRQSNQGLIIRALHRELRIILVFWAALILLGLINGIKWWLTGKPWYITSSKELLSEFLLVANLSGMQEHRLIPPSWYLESDLMLFFSAVMAYWCWRKLPATWRAHLGEVVWLATILLTALSLRVQALIPLGRGAEAPLRGMAYFLLGFLAWHAPRNRMAFCCLTINSLMIFYWTDTSLLHHYFCTTATVLVAWLLFTSVLCPALQESFDNRFIRNFSRISFSAFLLNYFVLQIGISAARHLAADSVPGLVAVMAASFALCFALSFVFYHWVQIPILRWYDKHWQRIFEPVQIASATPAAMTMIRGAESKVSSMPVAP